MRTAGPILELMVRAMIFAAFAVAYTALVLQDLATSLAPRSR